MKDEENMDDDDDQKDYSESDRDTIRMLSTASETEVWLDQILVSRFTCNLFHVKVEYENMILRNPNVCNLFKEIKELRKLRVHRKVWRRKSQFWRIGLTHQDHQTLQWIHHLVCNTQKKEIIRHGKAQILAPITKQAKIPKINVEIPKISISP